MHMFIGQNFACERPQIGQLDNQSYGEKGSLEEKNAFLKPKTYCMVISLFPRETYPRLCPDIKEKQLPRW